MFDDDKFFVYITAMFTILAVSRSLLMACEGSMPILGICSLFMIVFYILLGYICSMSIKKTKESKNKETKIVRHCLNGMLMFIILVTIYFNFRDLIKFKFKHKKLMTFF